MRNGCGSGGTRRRGPRVGGLPAAALAGLFAGCAPHPATTQPASTYDRQEQLLHDPFSYTPDLRKSDTSVSGNGDFDKEGIHRDVDHVLNP